MLTDQNEEAVELGREALDLADELGLDELRAQALNNIGSARVARAIPAGLTTSRRASSRDASNAIPEVLRGKTIGTQLVILGGVARREGSEAGELRALAERYGHLGFRASVAGGPRSAVHLPRGNGTRHLPGVDAFLAEDEAGSPHYQSGRRHTTFGA